MKLKGLSFIFKIQNQNNSEDSKLKLNKIEFLQFSFVLMIDR